MKKKIVLEWECQPEMDKIQMEAYHEYFATEDKDKRRRIVEKAGKAQAMLMIAEIDRDVEKAAKEFEKVSD